VDDVAALAHVSAQKSPALASGRGVRTQLGGDVGAVPVPAPAGELRARQIDVYEIISQWHPLQNTGRCTRAHALISGTSPAIQSRYSTFGSAAIAVSPTDHSCLVRWLGVLAAAQLKRLKAFYLKEYTGARANPACGHPAYHTVVLRHLPHLDMLDGESLNLREASTRWRRCVCAVHACAALRSSGAIACVCERARMGGAATCMCARVYCIACHSRSRTRQRRSSDGITLCGLVNARQAVSAGATLTATVQAPLL
jgi:hypothetical protein